MGPKLAPKRCMRGAVPLNHKVILLAAISLLWGSQFFFSEIALRTLPPFTLSALRTMLAALTLAVMFMGSPERKTTPHVPTPFWVYFGIALVDVTLPFCLIAWAQSQLDSGMTGILQGTVPIFVVVLSLLLIRGEKPQLGNVLCVGLGFVSLLILNSGSLSQGFNGGVLPQLAVLGGAACYALGIIFIRRLNSPRYTEVARNVFLAAILQLVPLALVFERPWDLAWSVEGVLALLVLGVFSAGIAKLLFVVLIDKAGPTFASLANYLVPMMAVGLGIAFLGEPFSFTSLVAMGILFMALGLNGLKLPQRALGEA
jgi:drug/metabolite transporter (DMT)-like permease